MPRGRSAVRENHTLFRENLSCRKRLIMPTLTARNVSTRPNPTHASFQKRVDIIMADRVKKLPSGAEEVEYLVKWRGLPESEASWEPEDALRHEVRSNSSVTEEEEDKGIDEGVEELSRGELSQRVPISNNYSGWLLLPSSLGPVYPVITNHEEGRSKFSPPFGALIAIHIPSVSIAHRQLVFGLTGSTIPRNRASFALLTAYPNEK